MMYGYPPSKDEEGPVVFKYDPFVTTNPKRIKSDPPFRTVEDFDKMKAKAEGEK